jgi:hypothetical protein
VEHLTLSRNIVMGDLIDTHIGSSFIDLLLRLARPVKTPFSPDRWAGNWLIHIFKASTISTTQVSADLLLGVHPLARTWCLILEQGS